MKRRFLTILLLIFMSVSCIPNAYAHNSAAEHWQDMSIALFGDAYFIQGKSAEVRNAVWALRYASQLCIDQFGADGGKAQLARLNELKITDMPKKLSEIALYPEHNDHRAYTHLGWNYDYADFDGERNKEWSTKTWSRRKELLLDTAEHIFDFNGMPHWADRFLGTNDKCDTFCKLLYYIHILGDQIEYNNVTYAEGKHEVMPLAATRGDCIISELISCLPILFPTQDYSELENELATINSNVTSLLNRPDELKEESGFASYHEQAEKVLEVLKKHLPGLLKNEEFFSNVFY